VALLFQRGGVQTTAFVGGEASDSDALKSPASRESGLYMVQEDAMLRVLIQELNQIGSRESSNQSMARPTGAIYALLPCVSPLARVRASGLAALTISVFPTGAGAKPHRALRNPR
jgi:hypothetical protein